MVDDWFFTWANEHIARHRHAGLPDPATEDGATFFAAWRRVFIRRGIHDAAVATEASEALCGEPLRWPREHFPRLVEIALEIYASRLPAAGGTPANSREAAEQASAGCRHCGGKLGLVTLWHPQPDPARRVPPTCAGHCVCQLGRWVRSRVGATREGEALLARIPDLHDVLTGRTAWLLHPPEFAIPADCTTG